MADSTLFKDRVSRPSVQRLGRQLAAIDPTFPEKQFVRKAVRGLDALELKARINHVADSLKTCLPEPFPRAAALIGGLDAMVQDTEESMFVYWPVCSFIERHGLDHLDVSFETMHGLTRLASCEFAVRPYIDREPERVFAILERWVEDDSVHVRRLVSEGTRPRLPWGGHLRALQVDPSPSIALLDRLYEDEALTVRRSVANHLNDIAKDNPDLAVHVAAGWKRSGGVHVDRVVRHALRTLVKAGHAGALEQQGFGPARLEVQAFAVTPERLRFGNPLTLSLALRAKKAGDWVIDYAVHRVLANGTLAPKVFKWTRRSVKKGERLELEKRHSIRAISTRRYYPGRHRCEVRINGRSVAIEDFELFGVDYSR